MKFRAIDLFCGAGGLSLGLHNAGFKIVAAVDNWQPASESYVRNFGHPNFQEDIRKVDREFFRGKNIDCNVDLIVGGPPCQGFSVQRIGKDSDQRNELIFEFSRIILELAPAMFLMENVPGLLGKRGAETARKFSKQLHEAGYEIDQKILEAADFGLPQLRKRVFFVGRKSSKKINFLFPKPTVAKEDFRTVRDAISDLPSPPQNFRPSPEDLLHKRMKTSQLNLQRLAMIPPGGGFEDLPLEMRVACHRNGAAKIGHRNVYGRLAPDQPAGTITARFDSFTRGRFAHPWEDRNISLREGARLQGFPDNYFFQGTQEQIAAQIGNAVPPPLAEAVLRSIHTALEAREDEGRSLVPSAVA